MSKERNKQKAKVRKIYHGRLRQEAAARGMEIKSKDLWPVVIFLESKLGVRSPEKGEPRYRLKYRIADLVRKLGGNDEIPGPPSPVLPTPEAKKKFATIDRFYRTPEWRRLRYDVLVKHGSRCMACGVTPAEGAIMNVDHIKPRKLFPHLALDMNNLQVLCAQCNEGKGNRDQTNWIEKHKELNAEFEAITGHRL